MDKNIAKEIADMDKQELIQWVRSAYIKDVNQFVRIMKRENYGEYRDGYHTRVIVRNVLESRIDEMKSAIIDYIESLGKNEFGSSVLKGGLHTSRYSVGKEKVEVEDYENRSTISYPMDIFIKDFIENKELSLEEKKMLKVTRHK